MGGCQNNGGDPLLELYCIVQNLNGSVVSADTAKYVDHKLKSLGFSEGLSLGLPKSNVSQSTHLSWRPILEYENNINGGNPHKDLVVGNYIFEGDETRVRKSGLLAGVGINFSGSYIYGPGRYISLNANKELKHNFEHELSIHNYSLSACSMNHVYNWWSLDLCFNKYKIKKKFATTSSKNLIISGSKIITLPYVSYTKLGVGIEHYIDQNIQQNRIFGELSAMLSKGRFAAFKLTTGQSVLNELTLAYEVEASVSSTFYGEPITLRLRQSRYEGGKFFGLDWSETSNSIGIEYPLTRHLVATVGLYKKTSSIGYFEEEVPRLGFYFNPFKF